MKIDLFNMHGEGKDDSTGGSLVYGLIPELSKNLGGIVYRDYGGVSKLIGKDASDQIIDIYAVNSRNSDFETRIIVVWYDNSAAVYKVSDVYWSGSTPTYFDIGTLTGASGSFSNITHDKSAQGGKVVFCDKEANTLWYVTMNNTATSDTVTAYTLPTGWEIQTIAFQDGFFLGSIKDSSDNESRRKVVQSDFGTHTFTSTNFYLRTAGAGNIVSVMSDNKEVFIFCEDGVETLYNAGASGFAFLRNNSVNIDIGVYNEWSVVKTSDSFAYIGITKAGQLGIFYANGYQMVDITPTRFRDDFFTDYRLAKQVRAFNTILDGDECIGFVTYSGTPNAWAYNLNTRQWFSLVDLSSTGFWGMQGHTFVQGETYSTGQGLSCYIQFSSASSSGITNTRDIVYVDDTVQTLWAAPTQATNPWKTRTLISKHIYGNNGNRAIHRKLSLEFLSSSAFVTISYSDDDQSTWSQLYSSSSHNGLIELNALGASFDRVYKVELTTANDGTMLNSWLDIEHLRA